MRVSSRVLERAMEAVDADEQVGICLSCGAERGGVEPDAERYRCEECGQDEVYGAEQIVLSAS